jgi:hypothetical protein
VWCGVYNVHRDCPKKENPSSTSIFCKCRLIEGETAHPSDYRVCRDAKEEMQKKKTETPKTTNGRAFSSNFTSLALSFEGGLRGNSEQKKQPHLLQGAVGGLIDTEISTNKQQ